jgi:hypothetical protein
MSFYSGFLVKLPVTSPDIERATTTESLLFTHIDILWQPEGKELGEGGGETSETNL